jgi:hypothetical protein
MVDCCACVCLVVRVEAYMIRYVDERDSGALILTHIYLLVSSV